MREILVYLSHCCLLFRKEFVKTNSFLFAFLNVFTSLAVDYYSTLVKNVFYSVLPSLFLQTFSSTDSSFVRTVCGMTAGFPAKPQVLWGGFLVSRFSFLVFKTLYGCGYSSASFDKYFGRSGIYSHNGAAAEQTAEIKLVPCFFADSGDNTYSGGL